MDEMSGTEWESMEHDAECDEYLGRTKVKDPLPNESPGISKKIAFSPRNIKTPDPPVGGFEPISAIVEKGNIMESHFNDPDNITKEEAQVLIVELSVIEDKAQELDTKLLEAVSLLRVFVDQDESKYEANSPMGEVIAKARRIVDYHITNRGEESLPDPLSRDTPIDT